MEWAVLLLFWFSHIPYLSYLPRYTIHEMSASSSKPRVNLRSTAVKRIMQEAAELAAEGEDDFVAAPLEVCPVLTVKLWAVRGGSS